MGLVNSVSARTSSLERLRAGFELTVMIILQIKSIGDSRVPALCCTTPYSFFRASSFWSASCESDCNSCGSASILLVRVDMVEVLD